MKILKLKIFIIVIFALLSLINISYSEIFFQDDMDCSPNDPSCEIQLGVDWNNSHAFNAESCQNYFEIDTIIKQEGTGAYHFTNGRYCRDADQCEAIGYVGYPQSGCDWASDAELKMFNSNIYSGGVGTPDYGSGQHFKYNQVYWIGFWVRLDTNIEAADYVTIDSGREWGLFFQIHHSREGCDVPNAFNNPPIALFLDNRTLDSEYHGIRLYLAGDPDACNLTTGPDYMRSYYSDDYGGPGADTSRMSAANFTRGVWHKIVINFKPAYDPAENPFFKLWIDDILTVNDTQPNCFNDAVGLYQDIGVYSHANEDWDAWYDSFKIGGPNSSYSEVDPEGSIPNQPPVCSIDSPSTTVQGSDPFTVNLQATCTDPDGDSISSYLWDLDGGAINPTVEDPGNTNFSGENSYSIRISATDEYGNTGNSPVRSVVVVGTPTVTGLIHDFRFGDDTSLTTDSEGNQANLTNNNSVTNTTGDIEPYGTYSAVFDGTNYFSITSGNYYSSAPMQTGVTQGTFAQIITTPSAIPTENKYLDNMWDQDGDARIYANVIASGNSGIGIFVGINGGASNEIFFSSVGLQTSTTYGIITSIDTVAKEVHGRLYQGGVLLDDWTGTITGTPNISNRTNWFYGQRSDSGSHFFNGRTSFYRMYNTILNSGAMDEVITGVVAGGDSSINVSGTPQIQLELGANDLNLNGVKLNDTTIQFTGTISTAQSHTSGGSAVTINSSAIDENGGSITGTGTPCLVTSPQSGQTLVDTDTVNVDVEFCGTDSVTLTLPTEGQSGSLSYETPFYVETSTSGAFTSTCIGDSNGTCITENKKYYLGDKFYPKWTITTGHQWGIVDGSPSNLAIPYAIDSGTLTCQYYGFIGSNQILFECTITADMQETSNLALSDVGDLIRNNLGTTVSIEDSGDTSIGSYNAPQQAADPNYTIIFDGTAQIRSSHSGNGSISFGR